MSTTVGNMAQHKRGVSTGDDITRTVFTSTFSLHWTTTLWWIMQVRRDPGFTSFTPGHSRRTAPRSKPVTGERRKPSGKRELVVSVFA